MLLTVGSFTLKSSLSFISSYFPGIHTLCDHPVNRPALLATSVCCLNAYWCSFGLLMSRIVVYIYQQKYPGRPASQETPCRWTSNNHHKPCWSKQVFSVCLEGYFPFYIPRVSISLALVLSASDCTSLCGVCLRCWLVMGTHTHRQKHFPSGFNNTPVGQGSGGQDVCVAEQFCLVGLHSSYWRLTPRGSGSIVCTNSTDPSDERPKTGRTQWDTLTNFTTLAEVSTSEAVTFIKNQQKGKSQLQNVEYGLIHLCSAQKRQLMKTGLFI